MDFYFLSILTIAVLLFVGRSLWSSYNIKTLLHPGFLFCILWILVVASYMVIETFPNDFNMCQPEMVFELYSFVIFTAVFFFLFKNFGKKEIIRNNPQWEITDFDTVYQWGAVICLIFAVIGFSRAGGSLNMFAMRENMVEWDTAMFYGEIDQNLLSTLIGIAGDFNQLLLIYSGSVLCRKLFGGKNDTIPPRDNAGQNIRLWLLLLPLLTTIFATLQVGGRSLLIVGFRLFFFGVALTLCSIDKVSWRHLRKIGMIALAFFVLFLAYSNYNLRQRLDSTNLEGVNWSQAPLVFQPFSSVINYLSSSVFGYQLRRVDFVTPELDMGEKSFGGLIFWQVPFCGLLGVPLSIGDMLGMKRGYSMKMMFLQLQEEGNPFFSLVATMYMTLYDDFGYWGTVAVLFLMVALTQFFYYRWFCGNHHSFFSFYFLLLFFWMWSNSIFDPIFAAGYAKGILYSIILMEIIRFYFKRRNAPFERAP